MTPEALAALHARCFAGAPPPWSAAAFRGALEAGAFLLTLPDAFLLGRAAAGEAELLTLAVAPEARRRGLGHALLGHFEAEARAWGAEAAFLEVAADNAAARALYARAGWIEAGRRPRYYGGRIDALTLRRGLRDSG